MVLLFYFYFPTKNYVILFSLFNNEDNIFNLLEMRKNHKYSKSVNVLPSTKL